MRYWHKKDHNEKLFGSEVPDPLPQHVVALPDDHLAWRGSADGCYRGYDEQGMPIDIPIPPPTLEQNKQAKSQEAAALYENAMNDPSVLGAYPQREIDTFHEQAREVIGYELVRQAHVADSSNPAPVPEDYPMLKAIADQHTDRTLEQQVERVVAKRAAFSVYCGAVTGKYQSIVGQIDDCSTQEELDAIDVNTITTFADSLLNG